MSYIFYWPLTKAFKDTEELLAWAKKYCPSYITNDVEKRKDDWYYRFHFSEEKDYMLFKLRWD